LKYAIISDIHGNFPALDAVLNDAKQNKVNKYLFLGDYANGFAFCNEVTETIRCIKNANVISGNQEGFLRSLRINPDIFIDHSGLATFCYKSLSPENLAFLINLSEEAIESDKLKNIYLKHISNIFFRWPDILKLFHSVYFRELYLQSHLSHDEYLLLSKECILSNSQIVNDIKALPEGIYLFGHNHIQFNMAYDNKLFINPGSCGEPLDGAPTAAYSILEDCKITERRVKYDINKTANSLRESEYYTRSNPIWTELRIQNIQTGLDYFRAFYNCVSEITKRLGETGVASEKCLLEAIRLWSQS